MVDSDYYGNESNDGEIMFAFFNYSDEDVVISVNEKIGQGVYSEYLRPDCTGIADFGNTKARTGGFGSTDK